MYFVLLYEVVDDFVNRRAPFRPEHLKMVEEAHSRGELVMAGAFSDPVDGAALVFQWQRLSGRDTLRGNPILMSQMVSSPIGACAAGTSWLAAETGRAASRDWGAG